MTIRGVWIGYVPVMGMVLCVVMTAPLFIDMVAASFSGNPVPVFLLFVYLTLGWASYYFYGRKHSRIGRECDE